jgi:hypothetical protein
MCGKIKKNVHPWKCRFCKIQTLFLYAKTPSMILGINNTLTFSHSMAKLKVNMTFTETPLGLKWGDFSEMKLSTGGCV